MSVEEQASAFAKAFARIRAEVAKAIVGQEAVVRQTLIAIVTGGHVLLEGVPGLGKTLLVRTIASSTASRFRSTGETFTAVAG